MYGVEVILAPQPSLGLCYLGKIHTLVRTGPMHVCLVLVVGPGSAQSLAHQKQEVLS